MSVFRVGGVDQTTSSQRLHNLERNTKGLREDDGPGATTA